MKALRDEFMALLSGYNRILSPSNAPDILQLTLPLHIARFPGRFEPQ
jgi:hypothetical protein